MERAPEPCLSGSRATIYRRRRPRRLAPRRRGPSRRTAVRGRTPADPRRVALAGVVRSRSRTVWARLLDDGIYLCSISTMYRLLAIAGENRERRRQRTHPARKRPELIARRPNEVWSWDIEAVVAAQGIEADQLTIHADRGTSMTSKPVAQPLVDLGMARSHSRPPCEERQSLQREPVQDPQVVPRLPRPVRFHPRRRSILLGCSSTTTTHPPPRRHRSGYDRDIRVMRADGSRERPIPDTDQAAFRASVAMANRPEEALQAPGRNRILLEELLQPLRIDDALHPLL
jgi:hypothetical protein